MASISITSSSQSEMENTTSLINLGGLSGSWVIVDEPKSQVSTANTAFAPISTVLAGFMVDSVVYSAADYKWIITARYLSDIPNTITGMYISRTGPPPYSQQVKNSFYVSQHPCTKSTSVCCLNNFKTQYVVGSFASNITETIGSCGPSVAAMQTLGMFDPDQDSAYVDGLFEDYPNSQVYRLGPDKVQLLVSEDDLRYQFAVRENLISTSTGASTGYKLSFFVGMSYFTLLPANALSTIASQTLVTVVVTDSLTFSFASEQDYTFIKYITMGLHQNKWVDSLLVERRMQYVRMGVVLPTGMTQNMQTGLIPLGSIRFAIASSLPDQMDASLWTNPCYSGDNTGMWDANQLWRNLYSSAAAQSCASQHSTMCSNPITSMLSSNLVEFYFPLGDGTVGAAHFLPSVQYYLYVYFDISVEDASGHVTVTKLFAQAPISELSVSRACESLQVSLSLLETTTIDMAIGLVGNEQDWQTSVSEFGDVSQVTTGNEILDTTQQVHSLSLQSGLITLVVKGDPR